MSQVGAEGMALHGYSARQILTHYYTGTTIGRLKSPHLVTVLLQSRLRSVVFSGATRAGGRPLALDATYIARRAANGQIALESEHGRLLRELAAPLQISSDIPITFDGAASSGVIDGRYSGSLQIRLDGAHRLKLINRVGLEAYLLGVVPAESLPGWPAAELQAQAIAARSYAVASAPQQGFDLYADTRSQEYGGYDAQTPSTDAAVEDTIGEVVTYAGKPVVAYYFASSGGATESVQNVFPQVAAEPYLRGVLDPYDATRFGPIAMPLHEAEHKLRHLLHGTLRSIVVSQRGVSPRIVSAEVVGSAGTTRVTGVALASALGLQSTWDCFTLSSSLASVAAGWDRACARPTSLRVGPTGPVGPTGSTGGGTVGPSGSRGSTGASGSTGTSGPGGATGANGGGAVGPSG